MAEGDDAATAKRLKDMEDRLAAAEADRDKWKDLSRKHEDRSKENASAADELKRLRESKQTDEEKLASKLAELEERANKADARALRAEVAQAKGLTAAQAKRLQGSSKEEMEADADELLEAFPSKASEGEGENKTRPGAPRKPAENLKGGGDPSDDRAVEMDPRKLAESVPRL